MVDLNNFQHDSMSDHLSRDGMDSCCNDDQHPIPYKNANCIKQVSNDHTSSTITPIQVTPTSYNLSSIQKPWIDVRLTSILSLIDAFRKKEHVGLTEAFRNHTFVGSVNDTLALMQYQTQLMMVDYVKVSEALFYQLCLLGFSNFGIIPFSEPIAVYQLCTIALDTIDGWDETMLPKDHIAQVYY